MSSSSSSSNADYEHVCQAARAQQLYRPTPLLQSDPLTALTGGRPVYLKLDCLQPSGSFKDRGMAHLCLSLPPTVTRIVSSSGGNAGLAAATVARALRVSSKKNLECTVVVPVTTKQIVVKKLRALGATVQVVGNNWNEADAFVRDLVQQHADDTAYVPPYEHPRLWTGHSTVVDEILRELPAALEGVDAPPPTILLSVGGGGLLCGVLEGLERNERRDCRVIAAETAGASCFGQSFAQGGAVVKLNAIDSVASSLGALQASPMALERALQYSKNGGSVQSAVCTDAEAIDACWQLARDHRLLVEPACGAALAVLYSERLRRQMGLDAAGDGGDGPIVVEVCGGSGVNLELLQEWKEQFGV